MERKRGGRKKRRTGEGSLVGADSIAILGIAAAGEVGDAEAAVVAGVVGQTNVAGLAARLAAKEIIAAWEELAGCLLVRAKIAGAVAYKRIRRAHLDGCGEPAVRSRFEVEIAWGRRDRMPVRLIVRGGG